MQLARCCCGCFSFSQPTSAFVIPLEPLGFVQRLRSFQHWLLHMASSFLQPVADKIIF
jgi:hypothetical protein